jgi:hypothetical protein
MYKRFTVQTTDYLTTKITDQTRVLTNVCANSDRNFTVQKISYYEDTKEFIAARTA